LSLYNDILIFSGFDPEIKLRQACAELSKVCVTSEDRIVGLGNELQHFAEISQELVSHCNVVVQLLSGHEFQDVMASNLEKLRLMKLRTSELKIDLDWTRDVLHHLLTHISDVRYPLEALDRQVTMLHNLGVSTRTCIAELGNRGSEFTTLAGALGDMAATVGGRTSEILDRLDPLYKMAELANRVLFNVTSESHEQLTASIDLFAALIESFLAQRCGLEQIGRDLADEFNACTESVMKIVISLQFHDILRQCFEHSNEALEQICDIPPNGKQKPLLLRFFFPRNYERMVEVCRLQSQQIQSAYSDFNEAVSNAFVNLGLMAQSTSEMLNKAIALDKIPADLNAMALSLKKKMVLIDQHSKSNKELSGYMDSVNTSIENIYEAIEYMGNIELNMRKIGLNSTIKAVHVGEGGEALIVLSGAIQSCALVMSNNGMAVSKTLKQIVDRFKVLSESRNDKENLLNQVKEGIGEEFDSLNNLEGQVEISMSQLKSTGETLLGELERSAGQNDLQQIMDPGINRAIALIAEVQEKATLLNKRFGRKAHRTEAIKHLRSLIGKYTIHSERKNHFSHLEDLGVTADEIVAEKRDALETADDMTEVWATPDHTSNVAPLPSSPDETVTLVPDMNADLAFPPVVPDSDNDSELDDNIELF